MRWTARVALIPSCFAALLVAAPARAYRPFDGTDADVAELGEFELELGPIGYIKDHGDHLLTVPRYVLNFGVADRVELVIDGRGLVPLDSNPIGSRDYRFDQDDVFLKTILRKGILQGETGPSVAMEGGPLLPEPNVQGGFGMSVAGIISFRNEWVTLHLNGQFLQNRGAHSREVFGCAIIEGPYAWRLRPVAELYFDQEFLATTTFSALAGTIWRVNDDLAFDLGLRLASQDGDVVGEVRAGVTWTLPFMDVGPDPLRSAAPRTALRR